jgi:hypothetical protein
MGKRLQVLTYSFFILAAYVGSLLWAFPGEFHPLVPYRPDLYYPVGLLSNSFSFTAQYPRPIAYLFEEATGYLGTQGAIAATIAVVFATVLLAALAVARISGNMPGPIAFLTYLVLLFTSPEFYFHHRFDVPAVLAGFFLLLAILGANSWLAQPRRRTFAATLACLAAMALAKETYDVSAPFIIVGLCWLHWRPKQWLRPALLVAATCVVEAGAEAFNLTHFHSGPEALSPNWTYAPDLRVASVVTQLGKYLGDVLPPVQLVIVALAFIFTAYALRHRWKELIAPAAFLLGGILALVPNAVLPRHYESQYAWSAAPLVFAVVLFVPAARRFGVAGQLALAAMALYSVHANAPIYASVPQQWQLNEEHLNRRIARALPTIRSAVSGSKRLLVTGLAASFHPWEHADFVRVYFGSGHDWTVIVHGDLPESAVPNVELVRARNVRFGDYQGAVRFREDGVLFDVLTGAAYRDAVANGPDAVLFPGLAVYEQVLASKPNDFMTLLKMGTMTLEWGMPERAVPYLRRAAGADASNPYPWFFMGHALRDMRDPSAARLSYEKAIALGGPDGNPVFRTALAALPPA